MSLETKILNIPTRAKTNLRIDNFFQLDEIRINNNHVENLKELRSKYPNDYAKHLQYDSNWSWLMAIVEFINSLDNNNVNFDYTFVVAPASCSIYDNAKEVLAVENQSNGESFMHMVYLSVLYFIDYSTQTQPNQ